MAQKISTGKLSFKDKWDKHLTQYLEKCSVGDIRTNGIFRESKNGKPEVRHGYIIDIRKGEEQIDLIKKYNLLCHPEDFKKLVGKPHTYAHHMNSSQVMCYNFFRPMLDTIEKDSIGYYGRPSSKLITLISQQTGITISPRTAKCRFEYTEKSNEYHFIKAVPQGRGESSSFDFYIEDTPIKLYFEIKYTESEFGGWSLTKDKSQSSIDNHYSYLRSGYSDMIDDSIVIREDHKEYLKNNHDLFNEYYQLFRNILKVGSTNVFSFFIFPKANNSISDEFSQFEAHHELFGNSLTNVKAIYWENLEQFMSKEFKDKYIDYLI